MRKLLLLLLLSLSLISLISAQGDSLAPYEMNVERSGEYVVNYIIYYPDNATKLYEHIASEDIRFNDSVNYPNYSLSEVGENYYIDTYGSALGRTYHILKYGHGWVLDAIVYKFIKDDNLDYHIDCKEKNKDKIKIKKRCK